MNRLITRITKLEQLVHVGPEAELRELSDAELERRLDESLMRVSEEDIRARAREHPEFYTPAFGDDVGALAEAAPEHLGQEPYAHGICKSAVSGCL